jgi:hypothetical protein
MSISEFRTRTAGAIDNLGYGANAKLLVGFDGRPWTGFGSNGTAYSDLSNHQLNWETNRVRASASRGVLTDYASGDRGATLDLVGVQPARRRFSRISILSIPAPRRWRRGVVTDRWWRTWSTGRRTRSHAAATPATRPVSSRASRPRRPAGWQSALRR